MMLGVVAVSVAAAAAAAVVVLDALWFAARDAQGSGRCCGCHSMGHLIFDTASVDSRGGASHCGDGGGRGQ